MAQQPSPDGTTRTTGSGGHLLKYSSQQVTVDLTPPQQEELARLQSRRCEASDAEGLVRQSAASLKALDFSPVFITPDVGLVKAEHDEVLISHGRQILRGLLKTKAPMLPAKPDHQSTQALVVVRPGVHGGIVHLELTRTVWDSNGNAQTSTVSDADSYRRFFAPLEHDGDCSVIYEARSVAMP